MAVPQRNLLYSAKSPATSKVTKVARSRIQPPCVPDSSCTTPRNLVMSSSSFRRAFPMSPMRSIGLRSNAGPSSAEPARGLCVWASAGAPCWANLFEFFTPIVQCHEFRKFLNGF